MLFYNRSTLLTIQLLFVVSIIDGCKHILGVFMRLCIVDKLKKGSKMNAESPLRHSPVPSIIFLVQKGAKLFNISVWNELNSDGSI